MIEFADIGKSCDGVPVIEGLNLKIERGEFVVIIGPSGSGKSTLLKTINRMQAHDAGKIALDPATRAAQQLEMKRVHQASGKTIVLVSHDNEEALWLATKIVLLDHGKIVQVGAPLTLPAHPANDFAVDFVGRSDIGIKLLSLQPASDCARKEPAGRGLALPADTNLREVVSFMSKQQLAHVNLMDAVGLHAGVLHAVDMFEKPAVGGSHSGSGSDRRSGGA